MIWPFHQHLWKEQDARMFMNQQRLDLFHGGYTPPEPVTVLTFHCQRNVIHVKQKVVAGWHQKEFPPPPPPRDTGTDPGRIMNGN